MAVAVLSFKRDLQVGDHPALVLAAAWENPVLPLYMVGPDLWTQPDAARLAAWSGGETGVPFVDACMRYLAATGWLNSPMRFMLVAFASYHLWLEWLRLRRCSRDASPVTSPAFIGRRCRFNLVRPE